MNQLQPPLPQTKPAKPAVNPFARALAETEQTAYSQPKITRSSTSPFQEAMARTGGNFGDFSNGISPDFLKHQQEEALAQQKKEALRKKLHDQVNPVDTTALFDAREREVKKQIDQLRQELKLLVRDVAKFEKDVELTLMTEVTEPGQSGSYYINFFQKLRTFIMFLRQKIKSANTWLKTSQGKKGKKKGKQPGMVIGGLGHEKTSTVQDMMHHERSTNYGGA